MAREHTYEVAKGNQVKPEHVGKKVSWMKAQGVAEALAMGHFESEAALVAAAEQQRDIAVREDIRDILSTDDGTLESAAKAAAELKIGAPRAGNGVAKVLKPETKVARKAADIGNKMFDRALTDDTYRSRLIKAGAFEQADLDEYVAMKAEATAAVEAKAAAKANGGTAPTA